MIVFTLFLAVLVVAAIGFRLGPRARHRRPATVFGISTAVVALATVMLLSSHALSEVTTAFTSHAVHPPVVRDQPVGIHPMVTAEPVRYANGVATGSALTDSTARSLVLYDTSGPAPETAELYATMLTNLVSHFTNWTAHQVTTYRAGEMAGYSAVFYLGQPGGGALPAAFLDDVVRARQPVTWIDGGLDQLQARSKAVRPGGYGLAPQGSDTSQLVRMEYKGSTLPLDAGGGAFMRIGVDDPTKVTVLATARRADGSGVPWAVRSGNLIYVCEDPLVSQTHPEGRNVVFADLLFESLSPSAQPQHRALVRLEDVNPTTDPAKLRAITDYLAGQRVPFSVGVFPVFRDPNGVDGGGNVTIRLSERPEVGAALRYAIAHGATVVLHGYTHQYETKNNPNNGRSADDAEFYLCHLDENQQIHLDGHVPQDSEAWALDRLDQALAELQTAGVPTPSALEFPHYMASAADYQAAAARFPYRYERALYFPGTLSGQPVDDTRPGWQMFPYAVRDAYGTAVIPENLDYVHSDAGNITQMLDNARSNLVVRDGVASFFYHPFLGIGQLPQLVEGLRAMGYRFVSGQDLAVSP